MGGGVFSRTLTDGRHPRCHQSPHQPLFDFRAVEANGVHALRQCSSSSSSRASDGSPTDPRVAPTLYYPLLPPTKDERHEHRRLSSIDISFECSGPIVPWWWRSLLGRRSGGCWSLGTRVRERALVVAHRKCRVETPGPPSLPSVHPTYVECSVSGRAAPGTALHGAVSAAAGGHLLRFLQRLHPSTSAFVPSEGRAPAHEARNVGASSSILLLLGKRQRSGPCCRAAAAAWRVRRGKQSTGRSRQRTLGGSGRARSGRSLRCRHRRAAAWAGGKLRRGRFAGTYLRVMLHVGVMLLRLRMLVVVMLLLALLRIARGR
jgi:hypothetical protein